MALVGVELEILVNEQDALTTRPPPRIINLFFFFFFFFFIYYAYEHLNTRQFFLTLKVFDFFILFFIFIIEVYAS